MGIACDLITFNACIALLVLLSELSYKSGNAHLHGKKRW